MWDIIKNPIRLPLNQEVDFKRFEIRFTLLLEGIRNKQQLDRHQSCREIVSLCRAAISGFAFYKDYKSIQKIVDLYVVREKEIADIGEFASFSESDLIHAQMGEMPVIAEKLKALITTKMPPVSFYYFQNNQAALHGMLNLEALRKEYGQTPLE